MFLMFIEEKHQLKAGCLTFAEQLWETCKRLKHSVTAAQVKKGDKPNWLNNVNIYGKYLLKVC